MHYPTKTLTTKTLKRTAATVGFAGCLAAGGAGIAGATQAPGTPAGPGHHHLVAGKVTAVDPGSFTILDRRGSSKTIDTSSSTRYAEPGSTTAPTGVTVGEQVVVKLVPDASGSTTPTASSVFIESPSTTSYVKPAKPDVVAGVVTTVTSTTIVVDDNGTSKSVLVSPSTVYREGNSTIAESAIVAGDKILAAGQPDATDPSDLDATSVYVQAAPATPPTTTPTTAPPVTTATTTPPTTTPPPTTPTTTPSNPCPHGSPGGPNPGGSPHASPDPQSQSQPAVTSAGSPQPSDPGGQPGQGQAGHGGWSGGSPGGPGNGPGGGQGSGQGGGHGGPGH